MTMNQTINFEQGWNVMQRPITKLKNIFEGRPEPRFTSEEYMTYYTTVYDMCSQQGPGDGYSQQLYDKYRECFQEYVSSTVLPSLRKKRKKRKRKHGGDELMLRELVKRWSDHKIMVRWLSRFFYYLDCHFTRRMSYPGLTEVGLTCFRDLVYREFKSKVRDAVIYRIDREREGGEQIDGDLLKDVLGIFVEIGMGQMGYYKNDFEAAMLKNTGAYYSRKASNWILDDSSTSDYMRKVEECLKREKDRVANYLHPSSEKKLIKKLLNATQIKEHLGDCHALFRDEKVDDLSRMYRLFPEITPRGVEPMANIFKQHVTAEGTALVEQAAAEKRDVFVRKLIELHDKFMAYVNDCFLNDALFRKALKEAFGVFCNKSSIDAQFLATFCHALFRDEKVDDLSRMYRLFPEITPGGVEPMADIFKEHVTAEGTAFLVKHAAEKRDVFVRKLIELHDKFMAYMNDCFLNDALFHKALKEAFGVFCNKSSIDAQFLATFCDDLLRKGCRVEAIEKVVEVLLAYISDKDLFAELYRKKLARRLLFDKSSANYELERSILSILKQQCGGQFTSKMEGMIGDLTLARVNQISFEEYRYRNDNTNNPNANPGIDLTVTVLTTGFWPTYNSSDLNLPAEMAKCVEVFNKFYRAKTKDRKLTWIYSLSTCNIEGKFETKTIELIVTTYQAAALLLFNDSHRLSYQEIATRLNLSDHDDDVVRFLHSLSCGKYKILNKKPNTKKISPTDVFEFNSSFTDKMTRIKIPLPPVDEKMKIVEDVVVRDRRYAIDASIVRIMKSRKVLGYRQLVTECVEQLRRTFKPEVKAIKTRIEELITREYLERDKDDLNLFRYLA